ncbi:glycosyltransferase [Schaedlerella arabinosiphila]|uniref:Glycosyltransferase n=1 Tax=Schaedlerella arabinosiphila TaxID=2044587 RepID=A0A426DHZ0_9FIRM|nr:glycosyltransferase [Schaedlerella arabinosiphila]RRK32487.1 glycosyltransferase [Schaedlerella arabinosiphila]
MELISVIMPTYNVEKYVEESVKCILNQSYKNIELVIVDDASTDGTYTILKRLSKIDKRIKLYRNESNQKICKTLNKALNYVTGKYIARMDGDDLCDVNRLEILKRYLDQHENCALVGSQVLNIDEKGNVISNKSFPRTWKYIKPGLKTMCCILHIWLARKNVYEKLKGYREIPFAEDYDFLLRGMRLGFRFANVDESLYSVRTRMGNTQSSNGIRQAKAKCFVKELYKKECKAERDLYIYEGYQQAIKCTDKEAINYIKAGEVMEKALRNRDNKIELSKNVLLAMIYSQYYRKHILEAVILRILIFIEYIEIGR